MSNPVDFNVVKLHPLMVETGFLTIKERISQGLYRCGLPNLSVEQEFDSVLSEYLMMTSFTCLFDWRRKRQSRVGFTTKA